MANNNINLPSQSSPLVDPSTGIIEPSWWDTIFGIYLRIGGGSVPGLGAVSATANNAFTLATTNAGAIAAQNATINTANSTASNAYTRATTALADASTNATAITALTATVAAIIEYVPITQQWVGTLPAATSYYTPISIGGLSIPVNFAGTRVWANTIPTANSTFTVSYIRGTTTTQIGTITIVHGGNGFTMMTGITVNLNVGDVIVIETPASPDATMANVGITLLLES